MTSRRILTIVVGVVAFAGCGDDGPVSRGELNVTELADGFDGPTQIALAPDGRLLVAELNGGEGDGTGRVLALPLDEPSERVGTPRSHAIFAPGSTPTSVVAAPWDDSILLVALWNQGEIVAVPVDTTDRPHAGESVVTGLEHPQHLLAVGQRVLVSDHATGTIAVITSG